MRIDVHAHYFPDEYLDLLKRFGDDTTDMARGLGAGGSQAELEARFELMEAANVQMQLLSVSPQLPSFADKASAIEGARLANDLYADLVQRYPRRFVALAALPLPHMEAALAEMSRALDGLGMAGVTITTSVLGRALVDPVFEPLYTELDRRGSILFIHPAGAGACSPLINDYKLTWPIGAPIEETIAITQLIVRGIPIRYPRIKIINTHLGGALPMLLQRLDNQYRMAVPSTPELPSVQAKRMWYDSVGHFHIPALRCACESLGADRIVLGTDFPYLRGDGYKRSVTYVENAGLPDADVQRILESNAEVLLGLE